MEIKTARRAPERTERSVFDRLRGGPSISKRNKVCVFWLNGRCRKNPCRFIHAEMPLPTTKCRYSSHPYALPEGRPQKSPCYTISRNTLVLKTRESGSGSNVAKKVCEKVVEKSSEIVPKKSPENIVSKRSPQIVADKSPKSVLVEAPKSVFVKALKDVSKEALEKALENVPVESPVCVSVKTQENFPEEALENVVEKPLENVHENASENDVKKALESVSKDALENVVEKASEIVSKEAVENVVEKSSETAPKKSPASVCQSWLQGNCVYGDQCQYLHSWFRGDEFTILAKLHGHKKAVTGIVLPERSNKLFSGSSDGTVRLWDCHTGQCERVVDLGVQVGSIISAGQWVFVGLPNVIKAWNTELAAEYNLDGPVGQVNAMAVVSDLLFAGVQDGDILVWKGSNETNPPFQLAAFLKGHSHDVTSLVVGGKRLYSGSVDHTIRVWDHETLQCIMTLNAHTDVVTSLICWDQYLFSCSLDHTVKVWASKEGNLEVICTHSEEHGVLALCMMADVDAKPILCCSTSDCSVRLCELPLFTDRGRLFAKQEIGTIQLGPGGLFFTGDQTGLLTVRQWLSKPSECAKD